MKELQFKHLSIVLETCKSMATKAFKKQLSVFVSIVKKEDRSRDDSSEQRLIN